MINEGIKDTNTDEDIYNSSYEEDNDDTSMSGLSISSDDGDTAIVVGVRKTNKHQQKGSTASPFRKNKDSKNTFNFDSPSVANSRGKNPDQPRSRQTISSVIHQEILHHPSLIEVRGLASS